MPTLMIDNKHKHQEILSGHVMECRELFETTHPAFTHMKRSRVNPSIGCLNARGQVGSLTACMRTSFCALSPYCEEVEGIKI